MKSSLKKCTVRNAKAWVFLLLPLTAFACNRDDRVTDEASTKYTSTLVQPVLTDVNYASNEESHYVVRNDQTHNKLLVFVGGSFSVPENYDLVCDHAATLGLDVVSVSYLNDVAAAPLGTSSDTFVFNNYREEICFGNPVSDAVEVDALNSINMSIIKLLQYLETAYADQNWDQYLTSSNTLAWDKIIVSGHSQGAGHACYLGKKNAVNRVVMFSGPNDYSSFYDSPANWLRQPGETPLNNQFSLLHTQDQIVSFDDQVEILQGLGLLSAAQNPVLIDDLAAPYENAHCLSLNISAFSNHNATVGGNELLPDVWSYLFSEEQ